MKRNASTMKKEYETAVGQASAVAFIAVARRHPDVTVGELCDLAKEKGLEDLTINQIFIDKDIMDFSKAPLALGDGKGKKNRKKSSGGSVKLRTVQQREAYRLSVLDSSSREWQSAPQIGKKPGGNPSQIRSNLNSLIEEGLVEHKGQARGTRYRLTKRGVKAKGK